MGNSERMRVTLKVTADFTDFTKLITFVLIIKITWKGNFPYMKKINILNKKCFFSLI